MHTLFGGKTASTKPTPGTPETSRSAGPTSPFPVKASFALGTAVAMLVAAHFFGDRTKGFDPATVRQAATLRLPHAPARAVPLRLGVEDTRAAEHPLNGVQQTAVQGAGNHSAPLVAANKKPANGALASVEPPTEGTGLASVDPEHPLIDDSNALDSFYAQLWTLQQHTTPQVVTILHYGDSPTTADLITGDVRALLQERFGDAGHGFNLGAKPWAWYGHRDVDISDKGWDSAQKDATGVGRMKASVYGLGGAIFSGSTGAQTMYTLRDAATAPQTAIVVDYLAGESGSLTVAANDTVIATIDTAGNGPAFRTVPLPAGTKAVKLAVTSGTVKLFGADFRRGDDGVMYDSLGLNGATTTVISRTFDAAAWTAELQAAKPSLIVINYGTNESQFGGLVDTLDKELRLAIDKTRAAAPGVPILIMSPMDRGEGSPTAGIHTNPQIPKIVAIQQRVAADTRCAFFNTYLAMGGDGTMARWYAAEPRLITADLIHPTPQGAEYVAQLFTGGLYDGFDRWKRAHNIGVVAVMDPVQAAAKRKEDLRLKKEAAAKARADAKAATAAKRPPRYGANTSKPVPSPQ